MATLTLTATWINLMSSAAAVSGQSAPGRTETYTAPIGEVRTYAGGRQRAITATGEVGTYVFSLRLITRTSVDTLRTWIGQTVQVRDHRGRRFFGVFFGVNVIEWPDSGTVWDVEISLKVVTTVEGV